MSEVSTQAEVMASLISKSHCTYAISANSHAESCRVCRPSSIKKLKNTYDYLFALRMRAPLWNLRAAASQSMLWIQRDIHALAPETLYKAASHETCQLESIPM